MPERVERIWLIEGREGTEDPFFRAELPFGRYTDQQMRFLLQLLSAKLLSNDEICASTGRKRKARSTFLDVHQQFWPPTLICGPGWEFTARLQVRRTDGSLGWPEEWLDDAGRLQTAAPWH